MNEARRRGPTRTSGPAEGVSFNLISTRKYASFSLKLSNDSLWRSLLTCLLSFPSFPCVTSTVVGDGYLGDQRPSSQASNPRSPQFDWGSAPTGDEEGPQDLRGRPLSMSLKRALWYEAFRRGCLNRSENSCFTCWEAEAYSSIPIPHIWLQAHHKRAQFSLNQHERLK